MPWLILKYCFLFQFSFRDSDTKLGISGITWLSVSHVIEKNRITLLTTLFSLQTPSPSPCIVHTFMEQVQFYISMTSVLDCLDHSNNTYKFLKWVAFPFDVKWSAVCLPVLSEQDHWHYSCYTIYLKESLSFNVLNPCAFVHDTAAVKMECKVPMLFKQKPQRSSLSLCFIHWNISSPENKLERLFIICYLKMGCFPNVHTSS